jgi:hypothetical protein
VLSFNAGFAVLIIFVVLLIHVREKAVVPNPDNPEPKPLNRHGLENGTATRGKPAKNAKGVEV